MAHILVVDDEPPVVELVATVLKKVGHKISFAYDGPSALKLLGVEPADRSAPLPDLVLLDIMMPVMDGLSVFKRMREDARTAAVPVVILTAKTQSQKLMRDLPASGYFEKPFNPGELRAAVARVLGER